MIMEILFQMNECGQILYKRYHNIIRVFIVIPIIQFPFQKLTINTIVIINNERK